VLSAVFIPAAFIPGISGQFFRQFAVTIAASTIFSLFVSLTLSPALCALLFKPHQEHPPKASLLARPLLAFFRGFNFAFDKLSLGYGGLTRHLLRARRHRAHRLCRAHRPHLLAVLPRPHRLHSNQDQGYLITVLQLPPGASLARTDAVVRRAAKIILDTPGIAHVVPFAGFDGATFTNAPNCRRDFHGR